MNLVKAGSDLGIKTNRVPQWYHTATLGSLEPGRKCPQRDSAAYYWRSSPSAILDILDVQSIHVLYTTVDSDPPSQIRTGYFDAHYLEIK